MNFVVVYFPRTYGQHTQFFFTRAGAKYRICDGALLNSVMTFELKEKNAASKKVTSITFSTFYRSVATLRLKQFVTLCEPNDASTISIMHSL